MAEPQAFNRPLFDSEFLRKLDRLFLTTKRAQLGTAKGERRSKRKGISIEFADYRDYVQGDDLRHVDWNIFSRLDALHLKLFQDHEDLTLHLLIDASKSMAFGTPPKLEFACRLAAAVGYVGLVGHDRVTVEAFSGDNSQVLAPIRGKASSGKLFAFLRSVRAGGATHLERSTYGHMLKNRARGVQFLISDFFDENGFEGCLRRLASSGSDAYAIQVLAPEEIDPQVSGDLKLVDSETGKSVEVSITRAFLERYHTDRDKFCESIKQYCVARGIAHLVVSSDTSVERLTLESLRKGGMIR